MAFSGETTRTQLWLTFSRWSTTKGTSWKIRDFPKPVGKIHKQSCFFEVTVYKAAFCSSFKTKPPNLSAVLDSFNASSNPSDTTILTTLRCFPSLPSLRISFWAWADVRAKFTHALPDVRDLRTSGNGCYQSPPFLRPRDQKKRRLWGREWSSHSGKSLYASGKVLAVVCGTWTSLASFAALYSLRSNFNRWNALNIFKNSLSWIFFKFAVFYRVNLPLFLLPGLWKDRRSERQEKCLSTRSTFSFSNLKDYLKFI